MPEKSYDEIMRMIMNACSHYFYSGAKDEKKTVIECATRIYIAQMNARTQQKEECDINA